MPFFLLFAFFFTFCLFFVENLKSIGKKKGMGGVVVSNAEQVLILPVAANQEMMGVGLFHVKKFCITPQNLRNF